MMKSFYLILFFEYLLIKILLFSHCFILILSPLFIYQGKGILDNMVIIINICGSAN